MKNRPRSVAVSAWRIHELLKDKFNRNEEESDGEAQHFLTPQGVTLNGVTLNET